MGCSAISIGDIAGTALIILFGSLSLWRELINEAPQILVISRADVCVATILMALQHKKVMSTFSPRTVPDLIPLESRLSL